MASAVHSGGKRRASQRVRLECSPPLLKVPPASRAGKGTTVRHEVFEAGAIFPSTSVNGQAHCIALTPFVPLSRGAGVGDYGVRKRSFRPR